MLVARGFWTQDPTPDQLQNELREQNLNDSTLLGHCYLGREADKGRLGASGNP